MLSFSIRIITIAPLLIFVLLVGCSTGPGDKNLEPETNSTETSPSDPEIETAPLPTGTNSSDQEVETEPLPTETSPGDPEIETEPPSTETIPPPEPTTAMKEIIQADVISVDVRGETGNYSFSVGIKSPDLGCEQYADWWEVVDQDGNLIYRRILAHSHVAEQPFVRSGGPVDIPPDAELIVRAHMNDAGYGGAVFKGSVESGFVPFDPQPDFAIDLENSAPLPDGCAF